MINNYMYTVIIFLPQTKSPLRLSKTQILHKHFCSFAQLWNNILTRIVMTSLLYPQCMDEKLWELIISGRTFIF